MKAQRITNRVDVRRLDEGAAGSSSPSAPGGMNFDELPDLVLANIARCMCGTPRGPAPAAQDASDSEVMAAAVEARQLAVAGRSFIRLSGYVYDTLVDPGCMEARDKAFEPDDRQRQQWTNQLSSVKEHRRKQLQAKLAKPPLSKALALRCRVRTCTRKIVKELRKFEVNPGWRITASDAKDEYKLTQDDLRSLPCKRLPNPHHESGKPMRLFNRVQIARLSKAQNPQIAEQFWEGRAVSKYKKERATATLEGQKKKQQIKEQLDQEMRQRKQQRREKEERRGAAAAATATAAAATAAAAVASGTGAGAVSAMNAAAAKTAGVAAGSVGAAGAVGSGTAAAGKAVAVAVVAALAAAGVTAVVAAAEEAAAESVAAASAAAAARELQQQQQQLLAVAAQAAAEPNGMLGLLAQHMSAADLLTLLQSLQWNIPLPAAVSVRPPATSQLPAPQLPAPQLPAPQLPASQLPAPQPQAALLQPAALPAALPRPAALPLPRPAAPPAVSTQPRPAVFTFRPPPAPLSPAAPLRPSTAHPPGAPQPPTRVRSHMPLSPPPSSSAPVILPASLPATQQLAAPPAVSKPEGTQAPMNEDEYELQMFIKGLGLGL